MNEYAGIVLSYIVLINSDINRDGYPTGDLCISRSACQLYAFVSYLILSYRVEIYIYSTAGGTVSIRYLRA